MHRASTFPYPRAVDYAYEVVFRRPGEADEVIRLPTQSKLEVGDHCKRGGEGWRVTKDDGEPQRHRDVITRLICERHEESASAPALRSEDPRAALSTGVRPDAPKI